jgi:subtilisin family serine protease
LKALRRKRQFLLMRRYAEGVQGSGSRDLQVRRQYAQSLIELKQFEEAIEVLTALIADTTPAASQDVLDEQIEARGLMGRVWKQKYVDAGPARDRQQLDRAIDAYRSVFTGDPEQVWHGINAASCMLRAERDGIDGHSRAEARAIAAKVLEVLERREAAMAKKDKRMGVWDYATRVEALVDLGALKEAADALDVYLKHPGMDAFEVSSTFRQFDEVLQLGGGDEPGRVLLKRLSRAAERLRSGGIAAFDEKGTRAMLVRVADPAWTGKGIPDLDIQTRMGTVISVTGSSRTVQALLKDAVVIAVDESRRSGQAECHRSLPFVRVRERYPGPGGEYSETGDGVLVAVIDNGIDVLHQAFRDAQGQSRIVGIWDQQDTVRKPPKGFSFGRLLRGERDRRLRVGEGSGAGLVVPSERRSRHSRGQHRRRPQDGEVRRRHGSRRPAAHRHFRRR